MGFINRLKSSLGIEDDLLEYKLLEKYKTFYKKNTLASFTYDYLNGKKILLSENIEEIYLLRVLSSDCLDEVLNLLKRGCVLIVKLPISEYEDINKLKENLKGYIKVSTNSKSCICEDIYYDLCIFSLAESRKVHNLKSFTNIKNIFREFLLSITKNIDIYKPHYSLFEDAKLDRLDSFDDDNFFDLKKIKACSFPKNDPIFFDELFEELKESFKKKRYIAVNTCLFHENILYEHFDDGELDHDEDFRLTFDRSVEDIKNEWDLARDSLIENLEGTKKYNAWNSFQISENLIVYSFNCLTKREKILFGILIELYAFGFVFEEFVEWSNFGIPDLEFDDEDKFEEEELENINQNLNEEDFNEGESDCIDVTIDDLEKEHITLVKELEIMSMDFENFKNRVSRDQDDLKIKLNSKILSAFLPILDNFERARRYSEPESEEAINLHISYQGLYKQLAEFFKENGVKRMEVIGEKFDPNLHEVVLVEPSDDYEEGFISEELERGFFIYDEYVLRHAKVKLSKGPFKAESVVVTYENSEEEKENIKALTSLPGVGAKSAKALYEAGFKTTKAVIAADEKDLLAVSGVGTNLIKKLKKSGIETSKKIRILFIEDDLDMRKLITEHLKYHGFVVFEAEDGIVGQDRALLNPPDLILLDLMLPKVDGVTLCQTLRSDVRTSHIPLLMITALEEIKYTLKDFGPVADDYIKKPFNLEELIERIKSLLKKSNKN